jgi:phenylpropionate dioxygenase-like ring-hydroxylating dioxygenase large terminal subunit
VSRDWQDALVALDVDIAGALAHGGTLPMAWYRDEEMLERERDRIFVSAWQYAGRAELVAEPGQYFSCFAAHVPIVVTRDRSGSLHGFVNVCRHRGHLVADGAGKRETLQCPYHAWTYGLDGCLRAAPRVEREDSFDFSQLSLLPVQVELFGPLVFVNPDVEAPSFAETYPELRELVAGSGVDLDDVEFRGHREWETPVNWKLSVENYLECYHCPTAHPNFSRIVDVDPDEYSLVAFERHSAQLAPVKASALAGGMDLPYVPDGPVRRAQFHYVWPNTAFNIEPGPRNFVVMSWCPLTSHKTHGQYDYFFGPEVPREEAEAVMEFSREVGQEDRSLVESVQRGVESRLLSHGRLLRESEQLIAHFQRLVYDVVA